MLCNCFVIFRANLGRKYTGSNYPYSSSNYCFNVSFMFISAILSLSGVWSQVPLILNYRSCAPREISRVSIVTLDFSYYKFSLVLNPHGLIVLFIAYSTDFTSVNWFSIDLKFIGMSERRLFHCDFQVKNIYIKFRSVSSLFRAIIFKSYVFLQIGNSMYAHFITRD